MAGGAIFTYIVDNTMLTHYYTLRYIASTLFPVLQGSSVTAVWSQHRDELILAFSLTSNHLVISCRSEGPVLYLHDAIARARRNTVDLFPDLCGERIEDVGIWNGDRTVEFRLGSGRRLAARLFGAQANVYLIDAGGEVCDAFRNTGIPEGGRIPVPTSSDILDVAAFQERLDARVAGSLSSEMKHSFPVLGATLVQECCVRAGISPTIPINDIAPDGRIALEQGLLSVIADLEHPLPRVYCRTDGAPVVFSIIPLRSEKDLEERRFDDVHAAVRFFQGRRRSAAGLREVTASLARPIIQRLEKYRRTAAAVESETTAASRASEYEHHGSLLMNNLDAFKKGDRQIILNDDGVAALIQLDPSLSPVRNAQRYFDKAKKAKTALEEGTSRLGTLHSAIARGEELLRGIEECAQREELERFATEHAASLEEFGAGKKSKAREEIPFRVFVVDGGFEVWAGKSSANNDLLTLKYAKPDDLWFHARGSSGSHVILRIGTGKGEPGKRAREQSAAIAAFYSRMKSASMVPVAMTEKRYVRKPKGAPPGTVVLEREKVIFVEPALPNPDHIS
jgi:predicted ribosome quality control (RQC) complex YloA/Tae2 family protein